MIKTSLFKNTFILLCIIGVLDYFGNTLYLYWTVWWFDIPMHFLGGVIVAMASVLVLGIFYKPISLTNLKAVQLGIFGAFVVGVLWEVFELYFEITYLSDGVSFYTDTISDLVLDLAGGLFGSVYAHKLMFKNK